MLILHNMLPGVPYGGSLLLLPRPGASFPLEESFHHWVQDFLNGKHQVAWHLNPWKVSGLLSTIRERVCPSKPIETQTIPAIYVMRWVGQRVPNFLFRELH